ncbi:MAG: Rpn family recombination-promoting nuclease/putative transposase, partial [Clostridiales Family XIII bacterium]|nr:Rpn family recombination-promoting nuclease/putative transposase [Clostridiales Family XIII bacterium]
MSTNRKYKSSVFTLFFNDAEKLIEVYNAIEHTGYAKDTAVTINTLEDALFMDRINDISFLLDGKLIVLLEHQSTINKNMPLRLLLYIGRLYEKLLDNRNIYRRKLIRIPKPDFIVLYNGDAEYPDRDELKLSDAFADVDIPNLLELTVNVYNINQGRSPDILQKSRSLNDYAMFTARVKANKANGM